MELKLFVSLLKNWLNFSDLQLKISCFERKFFDIIFKTAFYMSRRNFVVYLWDFNNFQGFWEGKFWNFSGIFLEGSSKVSINVWRRTCWRKTLKRKTVWSKSVRLLCRNFGQVCEIWILLVQLNTFGKTKPYSQISYSTFLWLRPKTFFLKLCVPSGFCGRKFVFDCKTVR